MLASLFCLARSQLNSGVRFPHKSSLNSLPRRIRIAQLVSWISTVVGVGLAIGPNWGGRYDGSLAVLTATFIAIVWYTYFTYRAVHRDEASRLSLDAEEVRGTRHVLVRLRNPTGERRIAARVFAEYWRDGKRERIDDLESFRGETLVLTPGREFVVLIEIAAARGVAGSQFGPAIELGEREFALLRIEAEWEDDLGATGTIGPDSWMISVLDARVTQFARITQSQAWMGVPESILAAPIERSQFDAITPGS